MGYIRSALVLGGLMIPSVAVGQADSAPAMRQLITVSPDVQQELFAIRDTAWRAYFGNQRTIMERIFPDNFISIGWDGGTWNDRSGTIANAADLAAKGGKLWSLEFPHTEIQLFGDVAVVYSLYEVEFEVGGNRVRQSGRATEVFRRRDGYWEHPSWHLDSGR